MKLIINGHAQHGKDFFADRVADMLGLRKLNASMWFAEKVLMPAFPSEYACVEQAYQDRVNHRSLWYEMMRMGDWQARFMEVSDIFCGHRNIEEHQQMVADTGAFRIWVNWVDKPHEPAASSQWQNPDDIMINHDFIFTHNGHPDELDGALTRLKEVL